MADISKIKATNGTTYSLKDTTARARLVPTGGTAGQVVTKTASGYGWADASGGGTVDTVNGISPDSNKNVQVDVELTQAQYDALPASKLTNDVNYFITDGGVFPQVSLVNYIYPVGSVYISVNNVSPATLFGGAWEQINDVFLLGAGLTYTAGDTGGEAEHTLIANEIPKFSGTVSSVLMDDGQSQTASGICSVTGTRERSWSGSSGNAIKRININFGGGLAHNNMPPYLVVYMWKRTA